MVVLVAVAVARLTTAAAALLVAEGRGRTCGRGFGTTAGLGLVLLLASVTRLPLCNDGFTSCRGRFAIGDTTEGRLQLTFKDFNRIQIKQFVHAYPIFRCSVQDSC